MLSDLHLAVAGAGGFEDDEALARFIGRLAAEEVDTALVLAGDVFDFLLDPSYASFDADRAVGRLERILAAHEGVVRALVAFAGRGGNTVTWLSGNHDPEVLLPAVVTRLEVEIGAAIQTEWELVAAGAGPALYGCSFGPERAPVWIAHGDRWDPDNFIDRADLRARRALELPLGSRLVVEVLRELRADYPWLYWLKPELTAVLPLLLYLDPRRTWGCVGDHLRLTSRMLQNRIRTATRRTDLFTGEPGEPAQPGQPAQPGWIDDLAATVEGDLDGLLAELRQAIEHGHPSARRGALTGHGGLGKWLLRAWLVGVRRSDRFQALDGPDEVRDRARGTIPDHVRTLVLGHTHGARASPESTYLNTGTWLPVIGIPDGPLEGVIDAIERGELPDEPPPRTFVEIELTGAPVARLGRCDAHGRPVPLEPATGVTVEGDRP